MFVMLWAHIACPAVRVHPCSWATPTYDHLKSCSSVRKLERWWCNRSCLRCNVGRSYVMEGSMAEHSEDGLKQLSCRLWKQGCCENLDRWQFFFTFWSWNRRACKTEQSLFFIIASEFNTLDANFMCCIFSSDENNMAPDLGHMADWVTC